MSDLAEGQVFGAWRILRKASDGRYLCLCTSCNETEKRVKRHDLETGKSRLCKSCAHSTKRSHGAEHAHASEYQSWLSMIARCTNPNNKDWVNYGGKGITVDPMWAGSFEAFFMQMGSKPTPEHTIDRIDGSKGYTKSNCRWYTRAEQNRNKGDNVHITIGNETKVVSEWARDPRCPVTEFTIYKRLKRNWDQERAVFEPSGGGGKSMNDGDEEKDQFQGEGSAKRT